MTTVIALASVVSVTMVVWMVHEILHAPQDPDDDFYKDIKG